MSNVLYKTAKLEMKHNPPQIRFNYLRQISAIFTFGEKNKRDITVISN